MTRRETVPYVRVDKDPETGLPGVGIVFRIEEEIRRLAEKR